jgi:hypothetical protein
MDQATAEWHQLARLGIRVPDVREVAAYLDQHPDLARRLPTIGAEMRQAFGPGVELSLELYQDPEMADRCLTMYVRQDKYAPDFFERIQAVSERFDHDLEGSAGYFLVTTDFARPRGGRAV